VAKVPPRMTASPDTDALVTPSATSAAKAAEFDTSRFQQLVSDHDRECRIGQAVHYFQTVESTMLNATEWLQTHGASSHGHVFVAEEQTKGVGRRSRAWSSKPKGNLYVSLVWAEACPQGEDSDSYLMWKLTRLQQLNFSIGVAIAMACNQLGVDAKVKWPNDVWVKQRKLAGILVDAKTRIGGIAGFGINVNQDFTTEANGNSNHVANVATSLSRELNAEVSREEVLAAVCANINGLMKKSFAQMLREYSKWDMLTGTVVRVHHRSREESDEKDFDAEVIGVSQTGSLRVKRVGTQTTKDLSGEEISITPSFAPSS